MNKACILAVFCIGFSGLAAQMTLIRELLIVFSGNELTIGIILANWLVLEAAGCFIPGRLLGRRTGVAAAFAWVAILFSVALPVCIYLTRLAKPLLGISVGEEAGFPVIMLVSFATLLPVSVLHGASFTLGCRVNALFSGSTDSSISRVYIWETVGTLAGGVVWTFLMIPFLHSFQTAALLAMINAIACLALLIPMWLWQGAARRMTTALAGLLLGGIGCAWLLGAVEYVHQRSVQAQWEGQRVVHYENSVFGNVCIVESSGQYIFFLDGSPSISIPVPDIGQVEAFVHIPLLAHCRSENILVLSGGAGGVINEILMHKSVGRVDYAELDPLIIELVKEFKTPLTEAELADSRVTVSHVDGRLFLREATLDYDVILVGLPGPDDLQTNRFFTREFFLLAARRLREDGILAVRLPGSFTYANKELRNLNSCIFHTMQSVFQHVRPIPGEGENLLLASHSEVVAAIDASLFAERLEQRELSDSAFIPWHIEQKLNPGWEPWFADFIAGGSEQHNRDFQPLGVFYSVAYWSSLLSPSLRPWFARFQRLRMTHVLAASAAGLGLVLVLRGFRRRGGGSGIPLCTATTGFAGMVFDLTLLFAFQSVYGYVFSWIGLLVAGFMTGSACGALLTNSARSVNDRTLFRAIDLAVAGFAFILPLVFFLLQPYLEIPSALPYLRWLFLLALFVAGLLTGAQYPLANRLYLKRDGRYARTAGLLYGADLLGGWVGGMAGGIVLLPILGLPGACVAVGLAKLIVFTNFSLAVGEGCER